MGFIHIIVSFLVLFNKLPFSAQKALVPSPCFANKKELSPKEQFFSKSKLIRSV